MALMPDDLLQKRFTPVRFSEGYDMDEVDSYLDHDILPRLQELIDENNRLTKELEEAHNRIAELESNPPAAADDHDETVVREAGDTSEGELIHDRPVSADAETTAPQQLVDAPQEQPDATSGTAAASSAPQDAAGIIALANRLHDEYVKNGEDERDRLINEANEEHRRIVTEAEEKSRATLDSLEAKKAELEKSIEGLRTFERDYRNRLRNYLENQLRELDTSETQDKQANFGL
ncbi:DivIVA domain-containing protein [Brachybacterium muris]|uniref:DivIVA domain-containing protein n=1 Tax=Brachybacterium muris TaxID=219301 RepID=UPI00223AA0D7|nr:DivIVA domain-containing protein [Brachybacterium muris]MCT2178330.1 DivIVA domain-containing protein [Brachybacterium muris]